MTLCSEHHQYDTGIFDSLARALLGLSAGSGRGFVSSNSGSFVNTDAGQVLAGGSSQMIDDGMDLNESVDNVITVAFLMFLTVLIAFLGAGLVALVLVVLMHSNPRRENDEEKQIREVAEEDGDGRDAIVVSEDEKL